MYDNAADKEILEKFSLSSGGMLSFLLKSGSAKKFVNALRIFEHTEGVNGVDSSVLLAGKLYEAKLGKHAKMLNIPESLVRVSVGIENVKDLIADLAQALAEAAK